MKQNIVYIIVVLVILIMISQQDSFGEYIGSVKKRATGTVISDKATHITTNTWNNLDQDNNGVCFDMYLGDDTGTAIVDNARRLYLYFDVSGYVGETITDAKLRMYVITRYGGDFPSTVHLVNSYWEEGIGCGSSGVGGLTGQSQPVYGTQIGSFSSATQGQWVEIDISASIADDWANSRINNYGMVIIPSDSNPDLRYYRFNTDDSSQEPELVLTYSSCTPDCSCASSTCQGSTCIDPVCSTTCAGTQTCTSCSWVPGYCNDYPGFVQIVSECGSGPCSDDVCGENGGQDWCGAEYWTNHCGDGYCDSSYLIENDNTNYPSTYCPGDCGVTCTQLENDVFIAAGNWYNSPSDTGLRQAVNDAIILWANSC